IFSFSCSATHLALHSFPTRRSSDLRTGERPGGTRIRRFEWPSPRTGSFARERDHARPPPMSYHDHHFHPFGYAATLTGLEVYESRSIDDLRKRLADHAERTDGAVIAERLNDERLAEGRLPTAADLDEAVRDR